MTKRIWTASLFSLLCLFPADGEPVVGGPPAERHGVVVDEVEEGFAAHQAGLRPGDVLLRWQRAAAPPANPEPAKGEIHSPFDLDAVELEQAPRGELELSGMRGEERLVARLPPGEWRLQTRPHLERSELEAYEEAGSLLGTQENGQGLAQWRAMASRLGDRGDHRESSWLFFRVAMTAVASQEWEIAEGALDEAQRQAEASGDALVLARIKDFLAISLQNRRLLERAAAVHQEALAIRQTVSAAGLGSANSLYNLGEVAFYRGDLGPAEDYYRRALSIQMQLAPASLDVAKSLNSLGKVAGTRSDMESAEDFFRRSLAIKEKADPQSLDVAKSLNNLGNVALYRGNLAMAVEFYRRSLLIKQELAPQSLDVAFSLSNLGVVALNRGDLAAAEDYHRRSLVIREKRAPQSVDVAASLQNLGVVASYRGDLAAADDYYRRALLIFEKHAPQSLDVASCLQNLGVTARDRGDLATAESYFRRALTIEEKLAPRSFEVAKSFRNLANVATEGNNLELAESYLLRSLELQEELAPESIETAGSLYFLGDLAVTRSDLDSAEARLKGCLAIVRKRAPGSFYEADACQAMATVYRHRKQLDGALELYECAVEALEEQKTKLGGSDRARAGFGAKVAGIYQDAIDLLVEVGQTEEGFHLLERYRARELRSLLAQRDLVFSSDVPEELEIRRRTANRLYDRAFGQWMRLPSQADAETQRKVREELERARLRQDEIRAAIQTAAPRLANLQNPSPLDLKTTRSVLDPGTLLLSYSIGKERSHLFAVGPGKDAFRVLTIEAGEESLRAEVESFHEALRRGRVDRRPQRALLHARQLSALLLAPVSDQIESAERLLILADGPLHSLPFAALTDPGSAHGRSFLVESKPVHLAASATVFALLKEERRPRQAIELTAFGDPRFPASEPRHEAVAPPLRAALRGGFDLKPLPATRAEVENLRRLFPQDSRIYLGGEATEGRAKAIGKETTHLHIASHTWLDDRFPLDSALAFSIPTHWREGEDNGLLQVWEIFEQMRIDADLVTLSACDTGLGEVLDGEGLLGLTRAFQYAGARSVLASLWSVSDESTSVLMERFYRYLQQGQSKADALRQAQVDLLRDDSFSHPFHWAGFELVGDWR